MLRSDLVLEQNVAAELASDTACQMAKIGVAVKNGIVTLSGSVNDPSLKGAALRAVKRVFGVDGVAEHFEGA